MTEPGTAVWVDGRPATLIYERGETTRVKFPDGRERTVSASRVRVPSPTLPCHLHAPPNLERPSSAPQPKPTTWRSSFYLDHVRALPCCSCGARAPSEPHHFGTGGGTGLKCSDALTAPLCTVCHRHFHDTGCLPAQDRGTSELVLKLAQRDTMAAWIEAQ